MDGWRVWAIIELGVIFLLSMFLVEAKSRLEERDAFMKFLGIKLNSDEKRIDSDEECE